MWWCLFAGVALAQGLWGDPPPYPEFDTQLYRMPVDTTRTLWTEDARPAPRDYASGRVVLGYLNGPIRYLRDDGPDDLVVRDALSLDLLVGIADKKFRFGIDVPLWVQITSDVHGQESGIGDLSVDVKRTLRNPGPKGLGFALSGRLTYPTAQIEAALASKGAVVDVNGIADWHDERLLVALNLGYRATPPATVGRLTFDDAVLFKLGGGYALTPQAGVSLDVVGQKHLGPAADGIAALPVEVMVGGWGRVSELFVLRGGLGTGVTGAVGAPAMRAVFSVTFEPPRAKDTDHDKVIDREDACIASPEDYDGFEDDDGCPDLDNDGDALSDVFDECPLEPEDKDGWKDLDGCPDLTTLVRVRVVDERGVPLLGVKSRVEGMGIDRTGPADFELELEPGKYSFSASGEGYSPYELSADIPSGMPLTATLPVRARGEVEAGTVAIVLRDQFGHPVDGTWAFDGDAPMPIRDGEAMVGGPPGQHAIELTAKAHFPETLSVEIVADRTVELAPDLRPGVGKLRLVVRDPTGRPVDATWAYDDVETFATRKGEASAKLPAGDYTLVVKAEGYATFEKPISLDVGADLAIEVVLQPAAP